MEMIAKIQKTQSCSTTGLVSGLTLTALIALSTALSPNLAEAAIYKCVEADGSTSYKQTPCAAHAQQAKLQDSASSNRETLDCRIANNFARKTAMSMRLGQTSGNIFDSYGGIDALPNTAIGVINYVYTHKDNVDITTNRIASLSAARCSAGSYGAVGCDDFPYSFISELGGCEKATSSTLASKPTEATPTADTTLSPALGVRTATENTNVVSQNGKEKCKQDLAAQMNDLFEQMRSGQSAKEQSALQDRKKALNTQLSGC